MNAMPPDHDCPNAEIIENIRTRLGNGDVSLALLSQKLDLILAQTTKTNGRVTKLEEDQRKPRLNWAAAFTIVTTSIGAVAAICITFLQLVKQ